MALVVKTLPASAGDMRHLGPISVSERFPRGSHGNPFQYAHLETPLYRGPGMLQSKASHRIKPDWSDLAHRQKNGEGMTFQGHSCCDNTARKLGFQVTVIRTIYVRHQAPHEHMAGTQTLECMYRLHHSVCVTSVLYICHKERMRPVIIFLLDWQMKL